LKALLMNADAISGNNSGVSFMCNISDLLQQRIV